VPEPNLPTRSMKRPIHSRLALAVAAIIAALALAACGGSTIDSDDLEAQLAEQLSAEAGADPAEVSVSCPEDIEAEEGREFDCTLIAPNGDEVRVEVTLTDDEGGFRAVVPREQFE
jgi:hypothetical protein